MAIALVCAVIGIFLFAYNFGLNSRGSDVAARYVRVEPVTDVLLIMSYDENEANTSLARQGVTDVLENSKVDVDVVYMDAYNAPIGSDAYNAFVSQLRQRVTQHGQYGAVICADDEALYFMENNHSQLFPSTPVVFFGINDFNHAAHAVTSGYMTGMVEQSYAASMMEAAYGLMPEATSFTVIVDDTPAGIGNRAQFQQALQAFEGMTAHYINASNLTRAELAENIAGTGKDTIVFYLDATTDRYGNVYSMEDTVTYLTSACPSPVFRTSIGGVGNGICGCGLLDPEYDGNRAAQMAIQVLNGTRPVDMPLVTDGTQGYVFDHQVLRAHGLSYALLPSGATIVNRDVLSFNTFMMVLVPLVLIAIGIFFFMSYRRIGRNHAMEQAQQVAVMNQPVKQPVAKAPKKNADQQKQEKRVPTSVKKKKQKQQRRQQQNKQQKQESKPKDEKRAARAKTEDAPDAPASGAGDASGAPVASASDHAIPASDAGTAPASGAGDALRASRGPQETRPLQEDAAKDETAETASVSTHPGHDMQWLAHFLESDSGDQVSSMLEVELYGVPASGKTLSKEAEEQVMNVLGERLEGIEKVFLVRRSDTTYLLGLANEVTPGSQQLEFIEYLLRQSIGVDGEVVEFATCIGIINRQGDMAPDEMVEGASFALHQARQLGGSNGLAFFDSDMKHAMEDREEIAEVLRRAIAHEDFIVFYQPQVDLIANDVAGYEALVRLKSNAYPPSQFVLVAEMEGLICDIDRIVAKRAIEQLAKWKKRNKRLRPVSINFSPMHIAHDDDFVAYLLDLLDRNDIPPEYVKIEITEGLFNEDPKKAEALLKRLIDKEITIALDKFGMDYTSLSDISSVPSALVKIDKSFVDTFLVDGNDANFEQLVRVAHGLGKRVIVVGIEKKWQLEICRELKCDIVQGYYFSKPLLPENAVQFKPR